MDYESIMKYDECKDIVRIHLRQHAIIANGSDSWKYKRNKIMDKLKTQARIIKNHNNNVCKITDFSQEILTIASLHMIYPEEIIRTFCS